MSGMIVSDGAAYGAPSDDGARLNHGSGGESSGGRAFSAAFGRGTDKGSGYTEARADYDTRLVSQSGGLGLPLDVTTDRRDLFGGIGGIGQDVLVRLVSLEPRELCSEAIVEKCRATRDLRSCGRTVQHILASCGHASLCAECSQRCDVCPICRAPIRKHESALRLRLFEECLKAGLITAKDEDYREREGHLLNINIQRLWSFFDVAHENNLVSLVCHYVTDVCMDDGAVSSDAIVSMLLDGTVVKEWCKSTFRNIVRSLRDIYNLGVKQMQGKVSLLEKFTAKLSGVARVLESLEAPTRDSTSAPVIELQQLLEGVRRASQHLEVMCWCARHRFLENVRSRHTAINNWRTAVRDRKLAAHDRAWPEYMSNTGQIGSGHQATLFIEDAMLNLGYGNYQEEEFLWVDLELGSLRQASLDSFRRRDPAGVQSGLHGSATLYPPESPRTSVDLFFLEGSSDLTLAKKAIFLYYLFDRHWTLPDGEWRSVIDDYVGTFGIPRHAMLESLVFYLLDDNSDMALEEACRLLPEVVSSRTHPKVARVLLERQKPDAALGVLRCSGQDGRLGLSGSVCKPGVPVLSEAVTAVRVRVECGLLTEAYLYQRSHTTRVKALAKKDQIVTINSGDVKDSSNPRDWFSEMEFLVGEICWLCIRRNLVDKMVELPWQADEENIVRKCLLQQATQDPSSTAGNLMVVFYILRCRNVEAYLVHKRLCVSEQQYMSRSDDEGKVSRVRIICEQRTHLVDKCIELLPEIQRQQLKSGLLDATLPVSLLEENNDFSQKELDVQKPESSLPISSSGAPASPLLISLPFSSKSQLSLSPPFTSKSPLSLLSFRKTHDINTPGGWGDYRQPSILHGQAFKVSSRGSSILSQLDHPTFSGVATQRDRGEGLLSPILGRRLRYNGESDNASQGIRDPDSVSNQQMLSVVDHRRDDEQGAKGFTNHQNRAPQVYFQQQPPSELLSTNGSAVNTWPSDNENFIHQRQGMEIDVLERVQNGALLSFENGASVTASSSPLSNPSLRDNDNGAHLEQVYKESPGQDWHISDAETSQPSSNSLGLINRARWQLLNLSPNGKRKPYDRSWLDASPSGAISEGRMDGSGAPNALFKNGDQKLSPKAFFLETLQRQSSSEIEVSRVKPEGNSGLRWRAEDDDGETPDCSLAVSRLKSVSNVGRSRGGSRIFRSHAL